MIADIFGDLTTAPFRFLLETKRGWKQLGITEPAKSLGRLGGSVFAAFALRDICFRAAFNYASSIANWNLKRVDSESCMKLGMLVSAGVLCSQPFDVIFVRMANDQVGKYSSIRNCLSKIYYEEGWGACLMNGFRFRFWFLSVYYCSMIFVNDFALRNKRLASQQMFV
jgi:hypothetical protein